MFLNGHVRHYSKRSFCCNSRLMLPIVQAQETCYPSIMPFHLALGSRTRFSLPSPTLRSTSHNLNTNNPTTTPSTNPPSTISHRAAGFIGSNFVQCSQPRQRARLTHSTNSLDAVNLGNLSDLLERPAPRPTHFVKGDSATKNSSPPLGDGIWRRKRVSPSQSDRTSIARFLGSGLSFMPTSSATQGSRCCS